MERQLGDIMSFRVSFGLAEILGIFGSYALVSNNWPVGVALLTMSIFGVFMRMPWRSRLKKKIHRK